MSEPAVGIIVRTKDRPAFLERALRSITSQTFREWECIIVNDGGSPERVREAVESLPAEHSARITVVSSEHSRGRWKSANAGVLATSAPLITLHDDDDSWHPDFLARAVEYLEDNPLRDGVVSRIEIIWEEPVDRGLLEVRREMFQPQLADVLLSDTLLFNRFVPIGFVYRRRLHEDLGLYNDGIPVIGDWDFNLRVLQRGPLEYVGDEPLAYWHQRVGAAGVDGNSVIEARGDHAKFDALLRDEALRRYIDENGTGLVLYLTRFIDQRFVDVENGLRREIHEAALGRRLIGRVRSSLGRTRRRPAD